MKHIGYCLSCYSTAGQVFSVPIASTRDELHRSLCRDFLINGEALAKSEFESIKKGLIGAVEVGWDGELQYFLEGMNLPEGTNDHD